MTLALLYLLWLWLPGLLVPSLHSTPQRLRGMRGDRRGCAGEHKIYILPALGFPPHLRHASKLWKGVKGGSENFLKIRMSLRKQIKQALRVGSVRLSCCSLQ